MTIFPFKFQLGFLEITGYGLMMMVAFLMGGWLIALELKRRGLSDDYAADMIAASYSCVGCTASTVSGDTPAGTATPKRDCRFYAVDGGNPSGNFMPQGRSVGRP